MPRFVDANHFLLTAYPDSYLHTYHAAVFRFPSLLRALDSSKGEMGIRSYGISVTTMEEVFLHVSRQAAAKAAAAEKQAEESTPASDISPVQVRTQLVCRARFRASTDASCSPLS